VALRIRNVKISELHDTTVHFVIQFLRILWYCKSPIYLINYRCWNAYIDCLRLQDKQTMALYNSVWVLTVLESCTSFKFNQCLLKCVCCSLQSSFPPLEIISPVYVSCAQSNSYRYAVLTVLLGPTGLRLGWEYCSCIFGPRKGPKALRRCCCWCCCWCWGCCYHFRKMPKASLIRNR